jgi:predicted DNA binding CopG/RHH family protein
VEEEMNSPLDEYESGIEENVLEYRRVSGNKRKHIESIIQKGRKTKNINIRISEYVLEKLREKSAREGIPYQTLISSILHKYVSDQLVVVVDILKSLKLIMKSG